MPNTKRCMRGSEKMIQASEIIIQIYDVTYIMNSDQFLWKKVCSNLLLNFNCLWKITHRYIEMHSNKIVTCHF